MSALSSAHTRSVSSSRREYCHESRSAMLFMAAHTRSVPSSSFVIVFRRSYRSVVICAQTRSVPFRRVVTFEILKNEVYI